MFIKSIIIIPIRQQDGTILSGSVGTFICVDAVTYSGFTNLNKRLHEKYDINDDITALGNGLSQLQDNVDDVLASYTEAITGVQIDDTVWTDGSVRIYQRGRTGIIYISLEGDLTISGNTNYTLHTIQDSDAYPTIDALGIVNTNEGLLDVVVNTSGEIVLYNNTNNQVHLTTIKGNIPVVWN